MQNIEQYVDELVSAKGFDVKDPDVLAQIKSDVMSRVEDTINAMVLANLPEESLEGFNKVLDSDDEEQIVAYVKKYVPDLDEKVAGEMLAFRSAYLG